jgi:hypothetical protein
MMLFSWSVLRCSSVFVTLHHEFKTEKTSLFFFFQTVSRINTDHVVNTNAMILVRVCVFVCACVCLCGLGVVVVVCVGVLCVLYGYKYHVVH